MGRVGVRPAGPVRITTTRAEQRVIRTGVDDTADLRVLLGESQGHRQVWEAVLGVTVLLFRFLLLHLLHVVVLTSPSLPTPGPAHRHMHIFATVTHVPFTLWDTLEIPGTVEQPLLPCPCVRPVADLVFG